MAHSDLAEFLLWFQYGLGDEKMLPEEIDRLREQYTDRYVVAEASQPELARFAGRVGQVKTVNMSGRALVQFEGADRAWYDIDLSHLKPAEKPA